MPSLPASLAGRSALALALALWASSVAPVRAQDAAPPEVEPTDVEPDAEPRAAPPSDAPPPDAPPSDAPPTEGGPSDDAEPDVDTGETPSAAPRDRSAHDPVADELPESASSGPSLAERQAAARRGELIGRPTGPDPSDPDLGVSMQLMIGGGGIIQQSSLDLALRSHDYGTPGGFYALDATITGRAVDWLWLGGRFGGRGRFYTRNDGPGGHAAAFDLMAVAHARFQLGRVIELGVMVGAGAAVVGLLLHDVLTAGVFPRLTAGVQLGLRIARGIRIVGRFSWEYCALFDIDRYGSDIELGGPAGALGLEVRL